MSYITADQILPQEVLAIVQQYVDGECLYIPRKEENKKIWGEGTGIRNELQTRNEEIYKAYLSGITVKTLTESFHLSDKSIWRIVSQEKRKSA